MKGKLHVLLLGILALVLTFSCARPPFSLTGVHSSLSSVHLHDREGSLISSYESLGVFVETEEGSSLQMEVTSPDGLIFWVFPAEKKSWDGQDFYGRASLSLGQQMPLPRGQWSLRLLASDGRTLSESFVVEEGSPFTPYQHQMDADRGVLLLDEGGAEYAIQLLDEKKSALFRSTSTEQRVDLTSLYQRWDKVRFVGVSWYDEGAKASQIVWYTL